MNSPSKLVCLFSDPNFLAINILQKLIQENCFVIIATDRKKEWLKKLADKNLTVSIGFVTTYNFKKIDNFASAIFCGGFLIKKNVLSEFRKFLFNKNFKNAKTFALFPYEITANINPKLSVGKNAAIVYIGDLLGDGIDLNSDLFLSSLVKKILRNKTLTLGLGELFYPLRASDVADKVTQWLISKGPDDKKFYLLGPRVSSGEFWRQSVKIVSGLKVEYDTGIKTRPALNKFSVNRINTDFENVLAETYTSVISNEKKRTSGEKRNTVKIQHINKNRDFYKYLRPIVAALVVVLLFPIFTTLISGGLLYVSYRLFLSGNSRDSQKFSLVAKTALKIARLESGVLKSVPGLNYLYREIYYLEYVGETASDLLYNAAPVVRDGKEIINKVLGSEPYDLNSISTELKTVLDYSYQQLAVLQLSTIDDSKEGVLIAKKIQNTVDFEKYKRLSFEGSVLAGRLADILGYKSVKNYLVLFQNNMELRPTGGFIGSYGIAGFGDGNLTGLSINDIYSADGQLRGHIEPPDPIKNYLGEANWWFRDSNWNPDFSTSAQRAEWFLGKEMGQKVDGVVSIDLNPIKNILTYTGPIFLPDYDLTITPENIYEKTQQEAQSNFFPGSRKKASFLTALSRVLLNQMPKLDPMQKIGVLKTIYRSLDSKGVQVYLHDASSQKAIEKLNWDGGVAQYGCGEGCYSDFAGVVEANLGVNKSNYFISRKIDLRVNVSESEITREMSVNLNNNANPSLGVSGQYETYIRVLIPHDAELSGVEVSFGRDTDPLTPEVTEEGDRKEAGVFVQINPGESKKIRFHWSSQVKNNDVRKYGLYLRKQAGTQSDSLEQKIRIPGTLKTAMPQFTLTGDGYYTYNTALDKDIFSSLSW